MQQQYAFPQQQPIYVMSEPQQSSWTSWLPWVAIAGIVGGGGFLLWKYLKGSSNGSSEQKKKKLTPGDWNAPTFEDWDANYFKSMKWKDAAKAKNVSDREIYNTLFPRGGGVYHMNEGISVHRQEILTLLGIDMNIESVAGGAPGLQKPSK